MCEAAGVLWAGQNGRMRAVRSITCSIVRTGATIFHKETADYEAFERIMADALERVDLKLFAYCLMPNHWHLVVSPSIDGEMSRFGQWLGLTHTQRYNSHYQTTGKGHLYQGRYKSFPIQSDEHFLSVCRYVERNAYSAELCDSPELWKYGSLWRWRNGTASDRLLLNPWPIPRRPDWVQRVREPLTAKSTKTNPVMHATRSTLW